MLTDHTMDTIKSTIPLLESAGPALTDYFYKRMFEHNPELKHIFNSTNQDNGRQPLALFGAIAAYAKNIDNLPALKQAVERIANKHTSLNIQSEHYGIVGLHLIETLRELAPDAFTEEVEAAWTQAYGVLADIFITTEENIYVTNAESTGGWRDGREFRLVEKRVESELVKSLVFAPVDKRPVITYKAGQYIGIKLSNDALEFDQIRQYSLSTCANNETYQISVKREIEGIPGVVSNYLHDGFRLNDVVDLFAPAGDFYFLDRQAPVCLISGGVGITPMMSILQTLAKQNYSHPCLFLHACENKEQHSFVKALKHSSANLNIESHVWYNNDHSDKANHHHGFMDLSVVGSSLPIASGHFYLCGPIPFMRFAKQQLVTLGVSVDNIHYEVFGQHNDF